MSPSLQLATHNAGKPLSRDLAIAQSMARRIVEAGNGRVRSVVLIGSRALGTPTAGSDMDLVVLVELGPSEPPWLGRESEVERDRIQLAVGKPPIATDLNVRSTDQFEEARHVVGGVERLIDSEGAILFSRPLDRPPCTRRSPERVRNALVRAWLDASMRSFQHGVDLQSGKIHRNQLPNDLRAVAPVPTGAKVMLTVTTAEDRTRISVVPFEDVSKNVDFCWFRSLQQVLTALCVFHQIETAKHDDNAKVVEAIARFSPYAAARIRSLVDLGNPSPKMTVAAMDIVLGELPAVFRVAGYLGKIPTEIRQWKKAFRSA